MAQTERTIQTTNEIQQMRMNDESIHAIADEIFEVIESLEGPQFEIFRSMKKDKRSKSDMMRYAAILLAMYEIIKGDIDDEAYELD